MKFNKEKSTHPGSRGQISTQIHPVGRKTFWSVKNYKLSRRLEEEIYSAERSPGEEGLVLDLM